MKTHYYLSILLIFTLFIWLVPAMGQNVDFTKANFPDQKRELKKAIRNIEAGDALYFADTKGSYAEALDFYLQANHFNPQNALLNYKIGVCFVKSYYKNLALVYLENAHKLAPGMTGAIDYYLGEAYQYQSMFREALDCYTRYKAGLSTKDLAREGEMIEKKIRECNSGLQLASNSTVTRFDKFTEKVNSPWDEYCPVLNGNNNFMAFTSRRNTTTGGKINPLDYLYFEDIFFTSKSSDQQWESPSNPGKPLNGKRNDATIELSDDGQEIVLYKNFGHKDFMCESAKEGTEWQKPVKLDREVSTGRYHEPSATFTKDRKTIYFVSDKKGGYGGGDLYMSILDAQGNWSEAVNLGNKINSPFDEEAPFLLNDSTLFFSSKGFNSMGGYDIFMTQKKQDGSWTTPVNMGTPLNSPADDLYMVISNDGEAYLSSDRMDGYGGFDIYHARLNFDLEEMLAQVPPVFIHGKIIDEVTNAGIVASVDIHGSSGENLVPFGTSDNLGVFVASLPSMKSYELIILPEGCDREVVKRYTDFGTVYQPEFAPSAKDTLARTKISGKILDKNSGKPYQFPIEIIDQKTLKVAARIIPDTNGAFYAELPSAGSYNMSIVAAGCKHEEVVVQNPTNYTTSVVVGMNVNIENVYFDFDRSYIRPDAIDILNRHAQLFSNYPKWKILVSGHTDNMGSETYNMILSKKRAQSVADYLISKGVGRHQLKIEWHGYSQPVTSNQSEEGRQLNRRCELSIIKD